MRSTGGGATRRFHWQVYPALLIGAFIAHGALADALIAWAWRAIGVAMAMTILLQVIATLALRDGRVGALVGLIAAFVVLGEPGTAVLFLIAGWIMGAVSIFGRRLGWRVNVLTPMSSFANVASVALALLTGGSVVLSTLQGSLGSPVAGASSSAGPDIYVILLDGYPRADTLAELYDFDNRPFLDALRARGFDVAERSESNYNMTVLTLASMLAMRHVDDVPTVQHGDRAAEWGSLARLLAKPEATERLRAHGYGVTMIASPFPELAIRTADLYIDSGEINSFEIEKLVQAAVHGPLGRLVAGFLADQHRSRIEHELDALATLPATPGPRFVMTHILSPHTPFVFGPNGEALPLQSCFPAVCGYWDGWTSQLKRDDFAQVAAGQITYLNGRVLGAIDAILARSAQPPVIMLLSDHGSRLDPDDPAEMFRNLFAAYTPRHAGLFGDDAMPVQVFPRLLNAYLGERIAEPDRRQFYLPMGEAATPLDYQPFAAR